MSAQKDPYYKHPFFNLADVEESWRRYVAGDPRFPGDVRPISPVDARDSARREAALSDRDVEHYERKGCKDQADICRAKARGLRRGADEVDERIRAAVAAGDLGALIP